MCLLGVFELGSRIAGKDHCRIGGWSRALGHGRGEGAARHAEEHRHRPVLYRDHILGALFTGIGTGALALAIDQIAVAVIRSLTFRLIVAAASLFRRRSPAINAVLGLSQIGMPSLIWRELFAWIGAILIGNTAWARMTVLAEPLPLTKVSDRCRFG